MVAALQQQAEEVSEVKQVPSLTSCWAIGKKAFEQFYIMLTSTTYIGSIEDLERMYSSTVSRMLSDTDFPAAVHNDVQKYLAPAYDAVVTRLMEVES